MDTIRTKCLRSLRETFGYNTYRPYQQDIVEALAAGHDVMAIMPTSAGKSVCFQIPCLVREGCGIIITPLISLMHDQVKNAKAKGIAATLLTSGQTPAEKHAVYQALRQGKIKLLYMSPERLAMDGIKNMLKTIKVAAIITDESHCVREYGEEFRPEYLAIAKNIEGICAPHGAFTATATQETQTVIIDKLALKNPLVVRTSANRKNLFYNVLPKQDNEYQQIADYIGDKYGSPGIVYRTTRQDVERTIWHLADYGIKCLPYHAGIEAQVRNENQAAWMDGRASVIVATIAFGMGVDKADVRWVLHADLPKSLEGLSQESGRAGRDGHAAVCTLLYSIRDIAKTRALIEKSGNRESKAVYLKQFGTVLLYAQGKQCRKKTILRYFGEALTTPCGACDICGCGAEYIKTFIKD